MQRRQFITFLGGAAVWPLAARAQQPAMPVIGFLDSRAPNDAPQLLAAIRQGLKENGFVEGQNVAIEYRFAENHNERLPALAADLVHRQVTVLVTPPTPAALAAKAATSTVPIVFLTAGDPVRLGLVASLARPGGNATGVTILAVAVAAKRLELLHELIPAVQVMALLVNPENPGLAEANSNSVRSAARTLGLELHVLNASTERDFDAVFAKLAQLSAGGLVIGGDPFFTAKQEQLATLAVRHAVPVVYENREFAAAGGLMSSLDLNRRRFPGDRRRRAVRGLDRPHRSPWGNHRQLLKSIREKLLPLGDDVAIVSGHGPTTTIGRERTTNPFL